MEAPIVPPALSEALAGRYTLERPIGQGGMATVFLARDEKHGRRVAVKVLRPDLAASLGAERFLREIGIAARLQHPHILGLIDSGEAAGFLYYVMPFIEGESLRGRMDRGPMLPDEVVGLARQVGDALEHAHRQGVIHRDIKPENILLSDGHAIVADFGIAKAVTAASDKSITRTGFPVGTVGYMSPEQAAGFAELNERSDVFSLTCVIYEMLVGHVPGMWPSEESGRVLRLIEAPAEHRLRLDRLPGSVEQVLVRGLLLRPEHRIAGPRSLVDSLAEAFGEKPRFTDRQVAGIVARAAELDALPTLSGNLSLGGIQQIAADVGISPEHVERAAQELAHRPAARVPEPHWFTGSANRIVVERFVDGEVSDAEYPAIVDEIRITTGAQGQSSTLGRALAWRTVGTQHQPSRAVSVSISPAGGRTRILIDESLTPTAGGIFGGMMGGLGGGVGTMAFGLSMGAFHSPVIGLASLVTALGSSFIGARSVFRRTGLKRARELEDLADRLASHIADTNARARRGRLPR